MSVEKDRTGTIAEQKKQAKGNKSRSICIEPMNSGKKRWQTDYGPELYTRRLKEQSEQRRAVTQCSAPISEALCES